VQQCEIDYARYLAEQQGLVDTYTTNKPETMATVSTVRLDKNSGKERTQSIHKTTTSRMPTARTRTPIVAHNMAEAGRGERTDIIHTVRGRATREHEKETDVAVAVPTATTADAHPIVDRTTSMTAAHPKRH
jgi:hypothetical protein